VIFVWSKMRVSDQMRRWDQASQLSFTDFLEAVCRVAEVGERESD
jgi:hypothetical protein